MITQAGLCRNRALCYGLATSGLVILACAVIASLSVWTLLTVGARVAGASARGNGEVIHTSGRSAEVRWSAPGIARTDTVSLAVPAPPVGARTEVAYDPHEPSTVLIPGSSELAALDRAGSGLAFSSVLAAAVLGTGMWQVLSRRRLRRRAAQPVLARRVRVQHGLLTRSWLEVESPPRWIPVHFDPVLLTMPAPAPVQVSGDPERHRLVAAQVDGRWLYPSGPVRAREPRGRRIDSPATPDIDALAGVTVPGWGRQLRADAALLTPAPMIGLLWTFLDGGGILTWACATALSASMGLWWAAVHGSDPT